MSKKAWRGYPYFHISRQPNLEEIRPTYFDIHGRMPQPAVFVTTFAFISYWAAFISEGKRPVYLYGISPGDYHIETGSDGPVCGDWKIITDHPLPVHFLRMLGSRGKVG